MMAAGLFGKLPARRDFIEHGVERAVMAKWDPWLQQAVSVSRERLGRDWLDIYLKAPIWRFWLGPGICGRTVLGALMPSVDGVGRYFPLTLFWSGEGAVAPPEIDEQTEFFAAAEEVLLGALGDGARYEDVLAAAAALPAPRADAGEAAAAGCETVPERFRALRRARTGALYHGLSCWWVHSEGDVASIAKIHPGLPAPEDYAEMLGGKGATAVPVAAEDV